jgi:hypothetical protein
MRPRPLGSLLGGTFSGRSEDPLTACEGARRGDADVSLISSLSKSSLVASVAVFLTGDADLVGIAFEVYVGAIEDSGSRKGFVEEVALGGGGNNGLAGSELTLFLKGLFERRGEGLRSAAAAQLA